MLQEWGSHCIDSDVEIELKFLQLTGKTVEAVGLEISDSFYCFSSCALAACIQRGLCHSHGFAMRGFWWVEKSHSELPTRFVRLGDNIVKRPGSRLTYGVGWVQDIQAPKASGVLTLFLKAWDYWMITENIRLNEYTLCKANIVFCRVDVVQLKIESDGLFLGKSFLVWFLPSMKNTKSILHPRSQQDDDVDGGWFVQSCGKFVFTNAFVSSNWSNAQTPSQTTSSKDLETASRGPQVSAARVFCELWMNSSINWKSWTRIMRVLHMPHDKAQSCLSRWTLQLSTVTWLECQDQASGPRLEGCNSKLTTGRSKVFRVWVLAVSPELYIWHPKCFCEE